MNLNDILNEWNNDSVIFKATLDDDALRIPVLHSKYLRMYIDQRLLMRKKQADFSILRGRRRAWYIGESTKEELNELGWLQYQGVVLKNQVETLLAGDSLIVEAQLDLDVQQEKVMALDQIMKMINNRSYQINTAVNFMKMQNGIG